MLVSVAIPAFNAADYLREAIDSVLDQTHQQLEIIVVDDGSTDHTREVCASYGERVRYFYQANDRTNGAGARAAAIKAATGEWIAILDQDDRWLPEKIEKQLQAIQSKPDSGLSFTGFRPIDEHGSISGEPVLTTPAGEVFHLLLSVNPYCASSALIKREAVIAFGLPEPRPGPADYELWLHLSRHCTVAMAPECLTEYRTHSANYSASMTRLAEGVLDVLDRQQSRLHSDCRQCISALREGKKHFSALAADAYLNQYHADARAGRLAAASASLHRAARLSPATVLSPLRALAIVKNGSLAAVRGRRREGTS
jgi:glycosyltransferase involved in cell wall biosynthesis